MSLCPVQIILYAIGVLFFTVVIFCTALRLIACSDCIFKVDFQIDHHFVILLQIILLLHLAPNFSEFNCIEVVEENSVSLTGRQASFRWPGMAYRKR